MYPNPNLKNQHDNFSSNKRYGYSKYEIHNHDFNKWEKSSEVKIKETNSGYHFELKILGYIKDDFSFYISKNDLVVTTEKRKKMTTNQTVDNIAQRHSYCYPSALFKRTFALPDDIVYSKGRDFCWLWKWDFKVWFDKIKRLTYLDR